MTQVFTGRPAITIHPTNQLIIVNTTINLMCVAKGDGIITYQWHKRRPKMNSWMKLSNSNNSIYVIERLQESSDFRCTVFNEAGMRRAVGTITVLSKIHT